MIDIEKYLGNFYKGSKDTFLSLDAMKFFMDEYNDFQKEMKFIHIAGTNGKGSCTEIINNILVNQGYRVGKFLSPHLIKYNERISINGKDISDEEMTNLIEELQPKIDKYEKIRKAPITLFELETIMGLLYFYRENVDFVVLETGLGGLYDCTNIITKPLVSIITSIGYDHMSILGNTLPQIAHEKAGIIKENSDTIFFAQSEDVNEVFEEKCREKNNELHLVSEKDIKNYKYDNDFQYFDYKDMKNIAVNLKGIKQINNSSICIECTKILRNKGYEISEESIRKGLSTVIHRGRMETLNKNPLIIFDGAHNEPAIKNLNQTIDMYYKNYKKTYIISILKTKDYQKILKLLLEKNEGKFILTSGNSEERYTKSEVLYKEALKHKKENHEICVENLEVAINEVKKKCDKDDVIFVVGSFYVYGDVIKEIKL